MGNNGNSSFVGLQGLDKSGKGFSVEEIGWLCESGKTGTRVSS